MQKTRNRNLVTLSHPVKSTKIFKLPWQPYKMVEKPSSDGILEVSWRRKTMFKQCLTVFKPSLNILFLNYEASKIPSLKSL